MMLLKVENHWTVTVNRLKNKIFDFLYTNFEKGGQKHTLSYDLKYSNSLYLKIT